MPALKPMTMTDCSMRTTALLRTVRCAALVLVTNCLVAAAPAAEAPKLRLDPKPLDRAARGASYAPVIKQVTPSVVSLTITPREQTWTHPFLDDPVMRRYFGDQLRNLRRLPAPRGLGAGVIVTEDGYILTNNHVVEDGERIQVTLADGKTIHPAKLVGADPQTDVAVIKIEARGLPVVRLADSSLVEVGDVVIAIGNPFNVGQTVTSGIVSGMGRGDLPFGRMADYEDFIQTDAAINPGNSGGPLVDAEGRLIGINTFIMSNAGGGNQGLGFAIPINLARNVLERLITDGRVRRGYLGVMLQPLDAELARQFKAPSTAGALVSSVQPGTPAARAGLREGDIITTLNGKPVADNRIFRITVSQLAPGTKVTLKALRSGEEKSYSATLEELPATFASAPPVEPEAPPAARAMLDDVELVSLDKSARRRMDIPVSIKGVLVRKVEEGSLPSAAGLRAGDVIVEVNRQPVTTAPEAFAAARNAEGDRLLLRVYSPGSDGGTRYLALEKPPGK
jgi:serine protease Do